MKSGVRISKPILLLCLFILFAQFLSGVNAAQTGHSAIFTFWYALAFYWALNWWFIHDSREHGITWTDDYLDTGVLLCVAWMFLMPYYLFKTRGWKSIYILGFLLGAYVGAYIMGGIFYWLVSFF